MCTCTTCIYSRQYIIRIILFGFGQVWSKVVLRYIEMRFGEMVRNSDLVGSGVEQRKYGKSFIMRCDDYIIIIKYIYLNGIICLKIFFLHQYTISPVLYLK